MANLFYGIVSDEPIAPGVTATVKGGRAVEGLKIDRLVVDSSGFWLLRSLVVGGRELLVHGDMAANAFVGTHPLLIECECRKGDRVVVQVTNIGGAGLPFCGVLSGPELED